MNYSDFQETIKTKLQTIYPDSTIGISKVLKWNGLTLIGLSIGGTVNVSPTIYLEPYYSDYLNGSDMEDIITDICTDYESHRLSKNFDFSFLKDFEQVKPLLTMRIVNTERNRELLQTLPHISFLDLSVVFYIDIDNIEFGEASIAVTNNLLETWEETSEKIKEIAVNHTKDCDYYSFGDVTGVIRDLQEKAPVNGCLGGIAELELLQEDENTDFQSMYVLSNRNKLFGAVAIYDAELLTKIGHTFQKDYYILPSSTHEILLVPESTNTDSGELRKIVHEVNRDVLHPQEFLSDNIYLFQWETNTLSIVEE